MSGITGYRLPLGSLTITPHSNERCWKIASENLILLSEAGSNLHGIAVGGDDRDQQGVCVEPLEVVASLEGFSLYEYRSKPNGVRSGRGDLDLSVYSLRKWMRLVMDGNPTHLLPLFTPTVKLEYIDWPGKKIRQQAHLFIAREHGQRFLGYLNRQRSRLLGERSQRTNRPELVEQYGLDTKFASHAMRIAMQGTELMRTGRITLPMIEEDRQFLIGVREGSMNRDQAVHHIDSLERQLVAAISESPLPAFPDYEKINTLLVHIYRQWWEERG